MINYYLLLSFLITVIGMVVSWRAILRCRFSLLLENLNGLLNIERLHLTKAGLIITRFGQASFDTPVCLKLE